MTLEPRGLTAVAVKDKLEVNCTLLSRNSLINPKWQIPKTANVTIREQKKKRNDGHYVITSVVHTSNFQASDAGTYKCHVDQLKAEVNIHPVLAERLDAEFRYGMPMVALSCKVTHLDEILISFVGWFHGATKRKVTEPQFQVYVGGKVNGSAFSLLTIDKPTRNDSGVYTAYFLITFRNSGTSMYHCPLKFEASPLVLNFPKSIVVYTGDSLSLTCRVIAYPAAHVTWRMEHIELSEDIDRITYSDNNGHINSVLTISNMKLSETGKFTCTAKNERFSNMTSSKYLKVYVKTHYEWVVPLILLLLEINVTAILIIYFSKDEIRRSNVPVVNRFNCCSRRLSRDSWSFHKADQTNEIQR
ncbi:hypothetical protein Btru_000935 [Bulinus truncatus]|nr:hypothetical protein Btru_000935 [Bulinus truncatus]